MRVSNMPLIILISPFPLNRSADAGRRFQGVVAGARPDSEVLVLFVDDLNPKFMEGSVRLGTWRSVRNRILRSKFVVNLLKACSQIRDLAGKESPPSALRGKLLQDFVAAILVAGSEIRGLIGADGIHH